MKYVKVETVLPNSLVKEIQKYIQGEYIYIPCQSKTRKRWGEKTGNREYIKNRNENIRNKYISGTSINDLALEFFLSESSIKKVIYGKSK